MFNNYLITAIRNLKKGLIPTLTQSIGLAIGIAVFILVNIIADYEENFDTFFKDFKRIYTVYVEVKPEAGFGMKSTDGVYDALQPVLEMNIPEIEKSARLLGRELMVKSGDKKFYQAMQFADPDFLDIIELDFIQGGAQIALPGPTSVIISKSTSEKYFGSENPIGKTFTVDTKHDMQITGVFADVPSNSHFNGSITSD
jgi:putative ABC transport system permease protein